MGAKGLEIALLSNFSPTFDCAKGLARNLQGILFGKGDLYTETPTDPDMRAENISSTGIHAIFQHVERSMMSRGGLDASHTKLLR